MLIDCHNHIGADLLFYLHGDFPYAQQLVQMQQEGGPLGITHWIVFPFVSYAAMDVTKFRAGDIGFGNGLESVPYAFENRRLLEECQRLFPEEGKKTLPFVMVDPMRDTDAQAAELVKLRAEYRFHGIKIQSTIIQSDIKRLAHEGRVFLDLAREWDVPFLIHSSVAESDLWAQAHDILDLAEANPDIRFCAAHSCRFDRECLDRVNALPNAWFDNSVVDYESEDAAPRFNYRKLAGGKRIVSEADYKAKNKKSPDHYFKNNFYFTIETEERELPEAMELFGASQFLFATDYPHDDPGGRMKYKDVELLDKNRDISEADKELLRYKNAERLLGMTAGAAQAA